MDNKSSLPRSWNQLKGWIHTHRAHPLWLLLGALLLAWGFLELLDTVREGEEIPVDTTILSWLVLADPPKWYQEAVRDITAMGSVAVLTLTVIAAVGFLLVSSQPRLALWVVAGTASGTVFSFVLKAMVARPRPGVASVEVFTHSFPSGHSMMSAVVFLTLGVLLARAVPMRRQKLYVIGTALAATFLVGVSRVVLGVHYPTDVLAGWSSGLAWALVFSYGLGRYSKKLHLEGESL